MEVGIVGSRTFNNYELLIDVLSDFKEKIDTIVSGGAKGADALAKRYAEYWSIPIREFLPDWNKYGKSAGFRRNQDIVDNSDMIFAFWDGKSKGTKDTIDKARVVKAPTFIVYF